MNQTGLSRVAGETLATLVAARAQEYGDEVAFRYLPDGEREGRTLTFGELEREAAAVAALLQRECDQGDRALIPITERIDFVRAFMGCQLAGVIPVPVYPPFPIHSERQMATLRAIARDCGARAVMSEDAVTLRELLREPAPELAALTWIGVDPASTESSGEHRPVRARPEDVSFLQYTSGSTSLPKGAMVSHAALMHNLEMMARCFAVQPRDVTVGWLPHFHDMGLISHVPGTVYGATETVLMPPLAMIQRPVRWLRAISRYGAMASGGPDFAYQLCVRRVRDEDLAELDLSSWRVAVNGAEPIRAETLTSFSERFGPCGFRERTWLPSYGMAECTLLGTVPGRDDLPTLLPADAETLAVEGRIAPGSGRVLVGCGRGWMDRRVEIVDPETRMRVEPGGVGEIWLAGPDIASGYWDRPEQSEETFGARIAGSGAGPFLRTGDLGALHDGELFVTGRLKDLIIIGGRNIYPQDVEATVEAVHPAFERGACAAFAVERGGEEVLVVVGGIKPRRRDAGADLGEIAKAVKAAVARDHGVPAADLVLVAPNSVPRTSSGKVQRRACRQAYLDGGLRPARARPAPSLEGVA